MLGSILLNPMVGNVLSMAVGCSMVGLAGYGLLNREDNENKVCNYKELKDLLGEGISCSKNVRLSVKQSNTHVLMVMPSDAGKTRRVIMQNVNKLKNCSIVATDPCREIEKTCKTNKQKIIFNPFSEDSVGYDPLANCKSEFEVKEIANVILLNGMNSYSSKNSASNQEDFVAMALPLLKAYMIMNWHTKQYTFDEMIKRVCILPIEPKFETDEDGNTKVYASIQYDIYQSKIKSAIEEYQSFKQVLDSHGSLSSIRIVMNSCLQVFFDENVSKMMQKKSLNIEDIRKNESILYIQVPEHHSRYFSPLVATLLTQMFNYFLENDGLQIYALIDEMANIGIIPEISRLLSTARKHKLSILGAIQSLTQFQTLYGDLEGKQLKELFKTVLIAGGLKDSADYISNLLGTKEQKENGTTYTKPLMTADQIRRLKKDEMLIICNNKRPVLDEMMDIVV
jgi:type IV secretion system protein VirD4